MMQLNDWLVQIATLALVCASAVSFPSIQSDTESKKLSNLLNELREELAVAQNQEDQRTNYFSDMSHPARHAVSPQKSVNYGSFNNFPLKNNHPLLSVLENRGDNSADIGVDKRQGSWDYDYGLGGGRFGKRDGFMDYSLGGGRFGRDVDHALQMEAETVDFEDILDD